MLGRILSSSHSLIASLSMSSHESTPLLPARRITPLPWFQLSILVLIQLAEPITSQVIYPFINKLVAELPITEGDETRVGYYAGVIESLFFVTEALTILQWSRWSDHVGRKPVLLIGLFGLTLSMISFGLSKSFWSLIISRCLAGLLNGNIGVLKSMMGELTDETNIAQGMALMPITWSTGEPMLGGWLSNPHERFPSIFGHSEFWKEYPYALPCFVAAGYCAFVWVLALTCLKEQILGYPRVVTAVLNYAFLAFLDITFRALQPLVYTTSIPYGGLGLPPPSVGAALGAFGLASGVFQTFVFVHIYNRLGPKTTFRVAISTYLPMFILFPLMNLSALHGGLSPLTWIELALQISLYVLMDMGTINIYIRASAPNDRSLGATNGLSQTCISIMRAIGPAASTSLFALSLQQNLLGGNLVYVIFAAVTVCAIFVTKYLPEDIWHKT
ncbi:MFS general substrate transporter [Dendrothele bispora CBS 962.96]|uniref:MFS general substrate transporter n=1 Tax=Dendrothele bispora (strain CBS 962.96) TaxID=1314807 RepID=A0A4S8MID5_DENBC|nr:MFS general substrate transporter [Dendrothele bispora CBS 962.96]